MKPLVFSIPQRIVHWLTAALVLFQLLLPGEIEHAADAFDEGKTPAPGDLTSANIHVYIGFAILALTAIRLILRVTQGVPNEPAEEPAIFRLASKVAHGLLYLLLVAMPILGISKYYLGSDFSGFLHGGPLKLLLWILIVGHVAAVFVHKFYWKTNVLERMTRG
jgi:cytochrome b561